MSIQDISVRTSTTNPYRLGFTVALAAWTCVALGCICLLGWLSFLGAQALGESSSSGERWHWIRTSFGPWPYGIYGILSVSCVAILSGMTGGRWLSVLKSFFSLCRRTTVRWFGIARASMPVKIVAYAAVLGTVIAVVVLGAVSEPKKQLATARHTLVPVGDFIPIEEYEAQKSKVTVPTMAYEAQESAIEEQASTIRAVISRQPSNGAAETQFDKETLSKMELWVLDTFLKKTQMQLQARGLDPATARIIDQSALYVTIDGRKLALIRFQAEPGIRAITVIGIVGDELVRVGCVNSVDQDFPLLQGECGKAMAEAFGIYPTR